MPDLKKSDRIDARKVEMLDILFETVDREDTISAQIGDLVCHFRALLAVEASLPGDTDLWPLGKVASGSINVSDIDDYGCRDITSVFDAERVGHMVAALRDAVSCVLKDDSPSRITPKKAYEDTYNALERFDGFLDKAAGLYKKVGNAIAVVPENLFADDELYRIFLDETESRDDLSDQNTLRQTILSFARSHDKRELAVSAISLDLDGRFIMDNFDWICEGADESWMIRVISEVEEVRNDQGKAGKLLKKLAEGEGLLHLFVDNDKNLTCGREFVHFLTKWVLSNLESVKSNLDLRYLTYVAADEDFPKLVDEFEKREAWRDIAYIRVECHDKEKRHHAQQVLDRNVDNIPTSVDLKGGRWMLGGNSEDDEEPSVFAIIGTIGTDENARLRAVERIRQDGLPMMGTWDSSYPKRILKTIIKGWSRYENTAVKIAAEKALEELIEADKKIRVK